MGMQVAMEPLTANQEMILFMQLSVFAIFGWHRCPNCLPPVLAAYSIADTVPPVISDQPVSPIFGQLGPSTDHTSDAAVSAWLFINLYKGTTGFDDFSGHGSLNSLLTANQEMLHSLYRSVRAFICRLEKI